MHVFIPFKEKIEDLILEQHLELNPLEDTRGFKNTFFSAKERSSYRNKDSITAVYLNAFKKVYILKMDDELLNPEYSVTEINNQLGFETFIPLKSVKEGKHIINLNRFVTSKKSKKLENEHIIDIPFWYFKQ